MSDARFVHTEGGARIESAAYVDTFFRELSPAWLGYVAALRGRPACSFDRPFTYMELGCGLGQSAVVNAGAYPAGEFHACDFNASHVEAGRTYAAAIGVGNVQFHECTFADLLSRDLPEFDFIVLHGVYSWVDTNARRAIREFMRQRLKQNGLAYVSYNCLPGWAVEAPLRKLLVELASSAKGASPEKAAHALLKLRDLCDAKLGYFNLNPAVQGAVSAYEKQAPEYLVHEFLTDSWQPFYSVDVADEMRQAGLEYVGSATLVDNHDALTMESRVMSALAGLETGRQRRLAEDFAMNRYFRRDVFARHTSEVADGRELGRVVVGRIDAEAPLQPEIRVPRGVVSFQRSFAEEVRELMSRGSMSIDDVAAALCGAPERAAAEIVRNVTFLVAAGVLTPFAQARGYEARSGQRRWANTIVQKTLDHAVEHRVARVLPSQVLGNGLEIEPLEALAIREMMAGTMRREELSARLLKEAQLDADGERASGPQPADPSSIADSLAKRAVYDVWPKLARLGLLI